MIELNWSASSVTGMGTNLRARRPNRGHCWTWGGKEFAGLGGAPSIDKMNRREHISWFSQEEITQADVDYVRLIEAADVLITHDAPPESRPAMEFIGFPQRLSKRSRDQPAT